MSKKNAFLIHLGFSVLIFSILLMFIIYVWYPAPYFDMEYRMKWIKLIAFVDIVIGPGLTLLVYKANKPSIRFDMSVIVALQISALSWGVWNAWSAHPMLNVYFDNQVYCLDHNEVNISGVDNEMAASPMPDQLMAILAYPETVEKKLEYLKSAKGVKPMVYYLGHLYTRPDKDMTANMNENQSDFISVVNSSEANKQQWKSFISTYDDVNSDWQYYRFNCFDNNRTVVFDRRSNKIEAILKINLPVSWDFQQR